jgi:hypothetical protein
MIDLIVNNLPVVLFVGIAIAVRVFQARARARRTEEAPPVFASSLEPDEDDTAEGRGEPEALMYGARTGRFSTPVGETAAARAAPRLAEADRPPFEALPGLSADEGLYPQAGAAPAVREAEKNTAPLPGLMKNTVPAAARETRGRFPRLEHCTPPQRAVVWAELLGKPKGMD